MGGFFLFILICLVYNMCYPAAPSPSRAPSPSGGPIFPAIPWREIGVYLLIIVALIGVGAILMGHKPDEPPTLSSRLEGVIGLTLYAALFLYPAAQWWRRRYKPRWGYALGWYSALQLVVLGAWQFDSIAHGEPPPWQFAFLFWFTLLIMLAAFKHRTLLRWWQAWDERGRPIDVEVLDPAPIARHRTF